MSTLRIFLADDHPVVRDGLRTLIESQPGMQVVGEAADGEDAVRGVLETDPDVALLDVSMPGVSGAEAAARIRHERPAVRVLALSAHEDPGYVRQMLAAGAAGYVVKRAAAAELVGAIRRVAAGETYLDPSVAGPVLACLVRAPSGGSAGGADLSDREAEVLKLIARGLPVKQIATQLGVGVRTVETYKARAMEKLGLKTRADAIRYAALRGWLADG